MKLIVTRPLDDATALANKLERLGHEVIVVPLLEIRPRTGISAPTGKFQALCVSSANGLAGTFDLSPFRHVPFFAIGPQSAMAARRNGFDHVHDKGGNIDGLIRSICKHCKVEDGPILYLAGSETTGDLEGKLKSHGFSVTKIVVYDALPTTTQVDLKTIAAAGGVLLYSPRTCKLWVQNVHDSGLESVAAGLMHFCLSANVAANLPQGWRKRTSQTPDENGMLSLLDQAYEAE